MSATQRFAAYNPAQLGFCAEMADALKGAWAMGPEEKARLGFLYEEMDAIHRANDLYWRLGAAQTPTAKAEYHLRNERLGEIRAELEQLRSELKMSEVLSR